MQIGPGFEVVYYASYTDSPSPAIPPPAAFRERGAGAGAQAASIVVNYDPANPFPFEAQAAFDYAVSIWAALITSPVQITVDASWESFGDPRILGAAGPRHFAVNFPGAPLADTWYPVAVANKLAGGDLDPVQSDIRARFNSARPLLLWYFGLDGNPGIGQYDFVSVVLHELGHGLGFLGSVEVDNPFAPTVATWGWASSSGDVYPFVWDRYVVNGAGQALLGFPNNSPELLAQVTGSGLFFSGPAAVRANNGAGVTLYAPAAWQNGSSYSHLDESAYPAGNASALMTPRLSNGEAVHDPGRVTLCMFKDMGWDVSVGAVSVAAATPAETAGLFALSRTLELTLTVYFPLVLRDVPAGC